MKMKLDFLRILDSPFSKSYFQNSFMNALALFLAPKLISILKYIIAINFRIYLQSTSINSAMVDREEKRGRGRSTKIIISQKQ